MSKVKSVADAISKRMAKRNFAVGSPTIWPMLLNLLQCLMNQQKPIPPTPPTSLDIKTESQREAWATACMAVDEVTTDFKENDGKFSKRLVKRTKNRIKHDKKRADETKPSDEEAESLAYEILEHTRTSTPAEIYPAALEAQQ